MNNYSVKLDSSTALQGDDNMNLWILIDQTRDVIAKARELELNHFKLTRVQASILYILIREGRGLTISEIANWNLKELHSVLGLINRMEKTGLIEKQKDKDNGKIMVVITEYGYHKYLSSTRRSIDMLFSILDDIEKKELLSILKKLRYKGRELLGIDYKPPFLP